MLYLITADGKKYGREKTSTEYSFVDNLICIVNGLKMYNDDLPVRLYLYNFDKKDIDRILCIKKSKLEIINNELEISKEDLGGYLVSVRVELLKEILEKKENEWCIYLDTDILVRGSLENLVEELKKEKDRGKFYAVCREKNDPKSYFQAGIYGINNTNISRLMVESWHRRVKENGYKWWSDQHMLYDVYEEMKEKMDFVNMSKIYNDCPHVFGRGKCFKKDSIIWHCQGNIGNEKWRKELDKYLKINN